MEHPEDRVYLGHVRDYAQEAISLLGDQTLAQLEEKRLLQLALWKLIEIVGEAANRVSPETRQLFTDVPWRAMIDMRNRITHGYDTVRMALIWATVVDDLPKLAARLEEFLAADVTCSDRENGES